MDLTSPRGCSRFFSLAVAAFLCAACGSHALAALDIDATTQPAVDPTVLPASPAAAPAAPARTEQEVGQEITATLQTLRQVLSSPAALGDAARRQAIAPEAIPLIKKILADLSEMGALRPAVKNQIDQAQVEYYSILSVLGDSGASAQLAAWAQSKDAAEALRGQSGQLQARWILANKDAAAQTPVVNDLEKLDLANTDSPALAALTAQFSQSAGSPDLKNRLEAVLSDKMTSPVAAHYKQMLAQEQVLKSHEGKPVVINGKGPDGKDFTTADWKGKVILVDFWATWCGPCKEELPRVKKIYADYHPKGLELLGVSNDYSIDQLKSFIVQDDMPWPEIVDADAAAGHHWNPVTLGFGIEGIPTMFLIDKKGILRTVEARKNMEQMIPQLLAE